MSGDDAAPDLREATLTAVRWVSAARLVAESAAFAASLALARLVPPAEFGRTVVALFLATVAQSLSSQGVGSFLVYEKHPDEAHRRAAMLLALAVGVGGTAASMVFAVTLAPPLFGDRVAELLLLAAPVTFFSALVAVPMADLQRRLAFRRIGAIDATVSVVAPVASVAAALAGLDGEAIILAPLVATGLAAAMTWASSRPPRPGWFPAEAKEIARYGAPATGSSMLHLATRNADYVILAAWLPAAQVGYYFRAFTLAVDYQTKISGILLRIAFPVLSRARDLEQLRRMRMRIVRTHASVLFPLLFALIPLAPTLVPFLYGDAWRPAVELTQILALGGVVAAVGTGIGPLLMATGHTRILFSYNLMQLCIFVGAVLLTVPHGLLAVCWAVVAVRLVGWATVQYTVVDRVVGIPFLASLRADVLPAFAASLCLLAATWPTVALLDDRAPAIVVLGAGGLVGFAAYGLVLRLGFPATWGDLSALLGRLAPRLPKRSR